MQKVPFYALLVGINEYKKETIRTLKGCVNDVNAVKEVLTGHFAVPDAHIRTLINEEATREGIINAFREHLIGQAKAWTATDTANSPPAFLFHYSGHGSQVDEKMAGIEPDGRHETIVPHDSRIDGVYDIKDWELRNLLDELAHYSDNITVVLDCCHSGAGTRWSGTPSRPIAQARDCPMDNRPQPNCTHTYDEAATEQDTSMIKALRGDNHVLLAACRHKEKAFEDSFAGKMHGTLTYFWVQELLDVTSYRYPTYQELYRRIRYHIASLPDNPNQTPQCEGAIDRELFGHAMPKQESFFDVIEVDGNQVWINGGAIHQLTVGTLLNIYPPNTRTLTESGPSLGMLEIEDVGVVQSRGSLIGAHQAIPLHAQASVHLLSEDEHFSRPHIMLDIDNVRLQDQIYTLLMERKVAAYIDVIDGAYYANFRLQEVNGQLEIQDGVGKRLTAPYNVEALEEVALDLERLVRYHNALELHNPVEDAYLKGKVTLDVKELAFNAQKEPITRDLPTTIEGYPIMKVGQKVVFELSNQASKPLYVALLEFSNDWSIEQYYPLRGTNEALASGRTIYHGLFRNPKKQLKVDQLPNGVDQKLITLKVFASTEATDFSILTQDALHRPAPLTTRRAKTKSALDELLQQAMRGRQTRFSSNNKTKDPSHEWTTTQMKVLIRRD